MSIDGQGNPVAGVGPAGQWTDLVMPKDLDARRTSGVDRNWPGVDAAVRLADASDKPAVDNGGRGYEAVTRSEYQVVTEDFEFSQETQRKFRDPDHTVIVVYDDFVSKTEQIGGRGEASHGGIASSVLRSQAPVREGIARGDVTVLNLSLGPEDSSKDNGELLARVLDQIPEDHRSDVLVSLSVGPLVGSKYSVLDDPGYPATVDDAPEGWQRAADRIRELGAGAEGRTAGDFQAFLAQGNLGADGGETFLAKALHGEPGVTTVASGDGLLRSGPAARDVPQAESSSVVGDPEKQLIVPSEIRITGDGDINGDGLSDLDLPDPVEVSKQYGSRPAAEFLDMKAEEAFASEAEAARVRQGGMPEPGKLYSMETLLEGGQLPEATAEGVQIPGREIIPEEFTQPLTSGMPNADLSEIYVDPVAASNFIASNGEIPSVVLFEQGADGSVQRYGGPDRPVAVIEPSTSFATPLAVAEYIRAEEAAEDFFSK